MKKNLAIMIALVLFGFYVSNLSALNTIDELAYVIGLGFDVSDSNTIKLSLQISIPASYSSDGSSSTSEDSTIITSVDCDSIDSGINLTNAYIGKTLNLSYCKVVAFSKDIAEAGIMNYVSTLINDIEVRPYCNIIVSKCDAKSFLESSKPLLESLSSKYYDSAITSAKNTGFTKLVTLLDFYNDYYDTCSGSFAMLGDVNASITEEKTIDLSGMAIFNNGKYSGELSGSEVLLSLITTNELQNAKVSIPSPFSEDDYLSLYISSAKSKKTVKIVDGVPSITCRVKLTSRILSNSVDLNYMTLENLKVIEEHASTYFKTQITDYLYKTSSMYNCDVSKFGKNAIKNFKTWDEWTSYDWQDKYQFSNFDVSVAFKLKSSYLVIGTDSGL